MKQKIYLKDIDSLTIKEAMDKYKVSRTSLWRLRTGKVDYLVIDYHVKTIDIDYNFDISKFYDYIEKITKSICHQKNLLNIFDDIFQECLIRVFELSGIIMKISDRTGREKYIYKIISNICKHYRKTSKIQYI